MMTGGIDSLLNNRMAAGRQDPQYLTNSYQKNQDLLDLLALQKLKSEKEAAKRQMLLQGGGTPPTVREQREQELVSMNKQELAQQVGGAAQQQMAQQQQAMQRMMGGVGGQQVPTMMAEGGIVGYQEGGDVDQYDVTALVDEATQANNFPRELVQWAKENPYDAISMGLIAVPMVGPALSLAGRAALGVGRTAGPAMGRGLSKLFTKAAQGPKGNTMPVLSGARQIAPGRVAGAVGLGMYGAGQVADMIGGEEASAGIASIPVAPGAADVADSGFRMQGVGQQPAAEQRNTPQPAPQDMGPNATQAQWLSANTSPATQVEPQAGLGALADQMARLEAERGDKWGAVSDWMRGVAGAKDNSLGMSLAGGADALDTRNRDLEERLSQLVDTQQKMDLAERAMGVDETRAQTEITEAELRREMMQLEDTLTREGWDREDARYAAQNQSKVLQAALSQGLSGSDAVRLYTGLMSNIPLGADPAQYADQAMRQTLEAMQLLGGTGGFNIVEELD